MGFAFARITANGFPVVGGCRDKRCGMGFRPRIGEEVIIGSASNDVAIDVTAKVRAACMG